MFVIFVCLEKDKREKNACIFWNLLKLPLGATWGQQWARVVHKLGFVQNFLM